MPSTKTRTFFERTWYKTLSDYVTAIAWSPDGTWLAASSAAGEVVQYDAKTGETTVLQQVQGASVDALAISADGTFLAAGGQSGTVWIWRWEDSTFTLVTALEHPRAWIDRLQWNPRHPELAFSLGRYAQVWDATTQSVITTLNFETSSVLDLAWHPQGDRLAVAGNQTLKTWQRQTWDDDPTEQELGGASEAIAWSLDGTYLASGNNDRSVLVWTNDNPYPWRMQGFPGKVRQLAWSRSKTAASLLASVSGEDVVIWAKDPDASVGWHPQVLEKHQGMVRAIAFQPQSLLLASAADDGCLCLWRKGGRLTQILQGAAGGFSCLAWHPQGGAICAGGSQGEVLLWTETAQGKGFG
ncbi:MAG: WD40 repeat domain-containing protein [Leptolyngbyaceae cyanobacterium]